MASCTHFDTTGNVTMVPNTTYSGPVKPKLDKFVELPFTSDDAEFNALAAARSTSATCRRRTSRRTRRRPARAASSRERTTRASRRTTTSTPGTRGRSTTSRYNFNSTGNGGQAGKIFSQLYFRQAFQMLVDQPLYIEQIYKGYGVPTYGPVPVCPTNTFAHRARARATRTRTTRRRRSRCSPRTAGRSSRAGRHDLHGRGEVRRAGGHAAELHAPVRERHARPRSS